MQEEQTVFDVARGEFSSRVLDASHGVPIVVDFWADWCAPCRTLAPVLERVVRSYGGRIRLARVNVDEDPDTAAQYGVQGIPAVKVFHRGQVIGEFMGALPEPEVARILKAVLPSEADDLVSEGDRLLDQARVADAAAAYRRALAAEQQHAGALLRLGTVSVDRGEFEEARGMLDRIEQDAPEYPAAQGLLARIEFVRVCRDKGGENACRKRVEALPDDLDARYDLACCLVAEGRYEEALEQFLEVLRRDKAYRDNAAREGMLLVFALIGPRSDLADAYRRKLAALLY